MVPAAAALCFAGLCLPAGTTKYRLDQLTDVDDTGDTQRPPESASSLRQIETRPIEVQMSSPTGPPADRIGHHTELARVALDRDDPQ